MYLIWVFMHVMRPTNVLLYINIKGFKMKKTLVNIVHPNLSKSIVNTKLLNGIKNLENITINNLYKNYPNFKIDIKKEQELLLSHDIIVFQFPMYWYSSPALLKEWFDTVLTVEFTDRGDYKLENKSFCVAISCGGSEKQFSKTGVEKKSVDEFLIPFSATANYLKMNYEKVFITYRTESGLNEDTLNKYKEDYIKYIKELY